MPLAEGIFHSFRPLQTHKTKSALPYAFPGGAPVGIREPAVGTLKGRPRSCALRWRIRPPRSNRVASIVAQDEPPDTRNAAATVVTCHQAAFSVVSITVTDPLSV
jgi:hypothetical protein